MFTNKSKYSFQLLSCGRCFAFSLVLGGNALLFFFLNPLNIICHNYFNVSYRFAYFGLCDDILDPWLDICLIALCVPEHWIGRSPKSHQLEMSFSWVFILHVIVVICWFLKVLLVAWWIILWFGLSLSVVDLHPKNNYLKFQKPKIIAKFATLCFDFSAPVY